jgi:hypothetical protein
MTTVNPHQAGSSQLEGSQQDSLDLGSAADTSFSGIEVVPYDPMKARENVRGWIALSLIGLLAGTILVSFILLWIHPERSKELHDLLALIFGPLVALVGAATGYYFGSQAATKS